jgi:exodeoxyribonuclease V alpha subunit
MPTKAEEKEQAGQAPAQIEGELTNIVFANEDDGYTVARIRQKGQVQLTTVVGNLFSVNPGEHLLLTGEWVNHKRFGRQFRIETYTVLTPTTVEGIQRYLASSLVKGIGPVLAKRLTDRFGEETLEIIENDPDRLQEVEGFGASKISKIRSAWDAQREIRQIMLFLQEYGIGQGIAIKIYRRYGNQAIPMLKENPYRLASDVFGIGFKTADRIARSMGVEAGSTRRAEAGLLFVLQEAASEGHLFLPYPVLMERSKALLDIEDTETLQRAIANLFTAKELFFEDLNDDVEAYQENNKAVYLPPFYQAEKGIAENLTTFLQAPSPVPLLDVQDALRKAERELGMELVPEQRHAVEQALREKCLIITGGPGTGKTTLVRVLVTLCRAMGMRCLLGAPTGRAAKRLQEVTGEPAKTLHRLLEYSFQKGGFQRDVKNPLDGKLLIVDEASMIDAILFHHLVKALPREGAFVLIGDVNQLPSVGPGSILKDLIESDSICVVRLSHIFRQARESLIITNAHRILQGKPPSTPKGQQESKDEIRDFYFIEEEDPERVATLILELCTQRIPSRFGFDPFEQVQVISPMHRGTAGAENLNALLQNELNPKGPELRRAGWIYRLNDKVMQLRNDYDKEVYNGDMGRIIQVDQEQNEIAVLFDDRSIPYEAAELDELVPAYAISVHKSQGNEYPAVILPLLTQHYMLLQRNLVYTAVTRGKKLVVIVGTRKALGIAIRNNKTQERYTLLQRQLQRG